MNPNLGMPAQSMQAQNASDATHRHPQGADERCLMKPSWHAQHTLQCRRLLSHRRMHCHLDSDRVLLLSVCLKSSAAVFSSESFSADKTTPG